MLGGLGKRLVNAAQVVFAPSGTAEPETVEEVIRRKGFDVQSYGATGDGATNDATAIAKAVTAAGAGGTVYFPKASVNYLTGTTSLTMLEGQKWVGEGWDASEVGSAIKYTGSGNAIESATRATSRIFRNKITDLAVIGSGKVASSCGIDLRRVDRIQLERVHVEGFDIGVRYDGTGTGGFRNFAIDCDVLGNNTGYQVVSSANEQLILGGRCTNNTNYGVDVQGGNSVTVFNVNLESNGVHVRTADANTRVLFGRMESATTFNWVTTSAASYFYIRGVQRSSGATYSDGGIGTDIEDYYRNAVRGTNLLKNGGFEVWSASTVPDGWTLSSVTAAEDTDAADIREGSSSVLLTAGATNGAMRADYDIPTFLRDGRREFVVMGWVKLGTSVQASFQTAPQDAGGTTQGTILLPTGAAASNASTLVTDSGWQFVWHIIRPNTSATRIRVLLYPDRSAGTGTANFDAICILPLGGWDQEFYRHPQDFAPSVTKILTASAALNFGDTASPGAADLTITVNGAAVSDSVVLGIPNDAIVAGAAGFYAWVSAANTVTVRFWNASGGNLNPASGTFRVDVVKH